MFAVAVFFFLNMDLLNQQCVNSLVDAACMKEQINTVIRATIVLLLTT